MILPSIRISVVILPSEIVYMIVIYAIVGGGRQILSNDGIIIIVLSGVDKGVAVSTFIF